MRNDQISYRIIAHVGTLAKYQSGWSKEVNVVSWNEGAPKIDIRDWDEKHEKMSRGITLTSAEAQRLVDSIQARDALKILDNAKTPNKPYYER